MRIKYIRGSKVASIVDEMMENRLRYKTMFGVPNVIFWFKKLVCHFSIVIIYD